MAEFEELTLQVDLIDNASAQLDVLKRSFAELGVGTQNLENLRRQTSELEKTMKGLVEAIGKGPEGLMKFAMGFGAVGVAIGGTVAGLEKLTNALTEMAREAVDLGTLARRIGVDPANTRAMIEVYDKAGIGAATAQRELEKFAQTMADVQRGGAGVREALQRLGIQGVTDSMEGLFEQLRKLPDMPAQWDAIKEYARIQAEAEARRSGGAAGVYERRILEIIGAPGMQSKAIGSMRQAVAEVDAIRRQSEARAIAAGEDQLKLAGDIKSHWKEITRLMGTDIMTGPLGDALKWIDARLKNWADVLKQERRQPSALEKPEERDVSWPQQMDWFFGTGHPKAGFNERFGNWPQAGGAPQQGGNTTPQKLMGDGGVAGFSGPYAPMTPQSWKGAADWAEQLHGDYSTNIERRDLMEDENAKTRELVNALKRANALLSGEEQAKAGSPLGLLSTKFGGLGDGLGAGGGMGRLPGFGGGGGGAGGGGDGRGGGTTTDGRPAGPFPPGTHGGPGGPPITPTAPGGTIPATLPGAQASLGYPTSRFTPVPSLTTASGQPPAGATGAQYGSLAEMRAKYAEEMKNNSAVRNKLMAFASAEDDTPEGRKAFIESAMNAAASEGKSLKQILDDPNFFPATTKNKANRRFTGDELKTRSAEVETVLGGSDITKGATGNYSKTKNWPARGVGQTAGGLGGGVVTYVNPKTGEMYGVDVGRGAKAQKWYESQYKPAVSQPSTTAATTALTTAQTRPVTDAKIPSLALDPNQISPQVSAQPGTVGDVRLGERGAHGYERGGVHTAPWLVDTVRQASRALPPGYRAEVISTVDPRDKTPWHPSGRAIDIQIYDDKGNKVPYTGNRNVPGYAVYERVAAYAKAYQEQNYPKEKFIWGGHFHSGVPFDRMHFQSTGVSAETFPESVLAQARQDVAANAQQATQVAGPPTAAGTGGPKIEILKTRPVDLDAPKTEWQMRGGDFGARARARRGVFRAPEEAPDRSVIDAISGARMRHRAIGTANIDVNVKSEGQKSVTQTGPFRKVRLSRVTTMTHSDAGPPASSGATGESHDPSLDS